MLKKGLVFKVLACFVVMTLIVPLGFVQNAYSAAYTYDIAADIYNRFSASTYNTAWEEPRNACDGLLTSKWCSAGDGTNWLLLDLTRAYNINRWVVKHAGAGGESSNYNTRDYKLQISNDGVNFTDIDTVTGNTADSTDRTISTVSTRFVRLLVTQGTQIGYDGFARIYELELYSDCLIFGTPGYSALPAAPANDVLKLTVTNNGSGPHYYYQKFSTASYTFAAGDYIEYDVKILNSVDGAGGIDCYATDGTYLRDLAGWQDNSGIGGHPSNNISVRAYNWWYHRKLQVPASMLGKTVDNWDIVGECETNNITYSALYDNIVVTDGNGTLKKNVFRKWTDMNVDAALMSSNASAVTSFTDTTGKELQAKPLGDVLKLTVANSTGTPHYYYRKISTASYTFAAGDYIEYDVKILNNVDGAGGIDCIATDGTCLRDLAGWKDQNNFTGHPVNDLRTKAFNKWYHRKLVVPSSMAGKTAEHWDIVGENETDGLTYSAVYDNIVVTDGNNVLKTVVFKSQADKNIDTADSWVCNASAAVSVFTVQDPAVITTQYPTSDIVIASIVVTDAPYNADNTGVNDATSAIQTAVDDCFVAGGGVVFMPAGKYKVTSSIIIPPHVTLRGDWRDPDTQGTGYGTVVLANVSSGGSTDPGLFRVKGGSAGVRGLTIYYPNQSASSPVAYPYAFEIVGSALGDEGYMNASVQDCTLINAYRGVCAGISPPIPGGGGGNIHELHVIRNVKGTALYNALNIHDTADVGRLENCKFNNSYWANSGTEFNAPSQTTLDTWTRQNGTGFEIADGEWEGTIDLSFSDYNVGVVIVPGKRALPTGTMFGIDVQNCNKALQIKEPNTLDSRVGYLFSNCTFKANVGTAPVAVEINNDNIASVIFNTCTIGGGAANAVKLNGNTMANFQNCTFDDWTGTYGLEASAGTLVVEGCTFSPTLSASKKGINLLSGLSSAAILGNTFTGDAAYLMDNSSTGDVKRQDTGYSFEKHNVTSYPWKTSLPKPPNNNFYNVQKAPYNAASDGLTDVTSIIQTALNDASTAGGGTVYLPAGHYKINTHLTVPANVELRGSEDVPHRGESKGTVLYVIEGYNTSTPDSDTAFITLNGANAGIRGLTIYYPNQPNTSADAFVAYPWAIRGNGDGVYAINVTFVNAFKGVDFATNQCNNHYLNYVCGTVLHDGIKIGNSTEGWMEDCIFNGTYWARTDLPNKISETDAFSKIFAYTLVNCRAYAVTGAAQNEHLLNNFVYGVDIGFSYYTVASNGPNAVAINCSADGSWENFRIDGTGSTGVKLINAEACGYNGGGADCDALHITGGTVKVFNMLLMEGNDLAVRVTGGTSVLQGAAFHHKMGLVTGGSTEWNGVLFRDTGTHVTVYTGVTNSDFSGNIGSGGFNYINNAGLGATFSNNITR